MFAYAVAELMNERKGEDWPFGRVVALAWWIDAAVSSEVWKLTCVLYMRAE